MTGEWGIFVFVSGVKIIDLITTFLPGGGVARGVAPGRIGLSYLWGRDFGP